MKNIEWFSIKDKLPKPNVSVITWNGNDIKICNYTKAITWKGYQMKFVNIFSHGFWDDEVTHWMYFPSPPQE
jgi:hypothetical protein